jgi:ubiquinone/menaquinone biosynthesis C-methylase UbiE
MQRRDEDGVETTAIARNVAAARAALTDEQLRRVKFAIQDAEALDLPRERFDIALCGWSL